MFSYNNNIKEKELYVSIPQNIRYNFIYLNSITELMKKVYDSRCEKIRLSCSEDNIDIDKLGTAYLYNTLLSFSRRKTVYVNKTLYQLFHDTVCHTDGKKFEKIDLERDSESKIQQCYSIKDDKAVNQTVQILVEFIVKNNLIFENAKEFLITTIGEIFSNAFNHSDKSYVLFMYDIEVQNEKVYLVINITDYGKTIIYNVQEYQKRYYRRLPTGQECIRWAMGEGNTTRQGSGGYGLPTLKEYVSNINGELLIFSGNAIYALKGTKETILDAKGDFYGTSISMKIPLFNTSRALMYDEIEKKIISIEMYKL